MIFRSRRRRGATTGDGPTALSANGKSTEELIEEIEALTAADRGQRDPGLERRILRLRHLAGLRLAEASGARPEHPTPAFELLPDGSAPPEVPQNELTPELLRAAILQHGCLLVRGMVDADEAAYLVEGIDRAFEARDAYRSGGPNRDGYYEDFVPDPRFDLGPERMAISDASNLWGADSPRVMTDLVDAFERTGVRRLATGYLGERPAISVNKCTLRRVFPDTFTEDTPSFWHQDGAFLSDVRALNVWLALSRCGDVAPGLDIVPRRLDHIVPTGTEGAVFDWSASQEIAEEAAGNVGILRPTFEPGDVLLFDEFLLHATGADPGMPDTRYAVESWFFGPSAFPDNYVPLAF